MQKNQTKEASFLQIFLSAIKFIFLSMQFGYWSQYFWLIIMEQIPARFSESFVLNLCATVFFSLLLLLTMRSFLFANLKSSVFSGDMHNFCCEDEISMEIRACNICDAPKSKRIHHCSLCEKCINRMDHHSLVIGKCIGKSNYKYFMSYVVYVLIDSSLLIALSLPDLWRVIGLDLKAIKASITRLIIMNIFSGFAFFACLAWVLVQIYCLLNDVTFIELMNIVEYNLLKIIYGLFNSNRRQVMRKTFLKAWIAYFENASVFSVFYPNERNAKIK